MTTEERVDHAIHETDQRLDYILKNYQPWLDLQQALGHLTEACMALWVTAIRADNRPHLIRREAVHLAALAVRFIVEMASGELEGHKLVDIRCIRCQRTYTLLVPEEGMKKWKEEGWLIQHAFPGMDPGDRELLKTHICAVCWDRMVPAEEEKKAPF